MRSIITRAWAVCALLLPVASSSAAEPISWGVDASGAWSVPGSWSGLVPPDGANAHARFGAVITLPRTVSLSAPATVGAVTLDSPQSYTLSGPAALSLQGDGGATIDFLRGTHYLNTTLRLLSPTTMTVAAGASVGFGFSARIDLTDQQLRVAGPQAATAPLLLALQLGYANGTWNGPGLTSSAARTDPLRLTTIGYALAPDPATSGADLLLAYTYYGDADLNGVVNANDLAMMQLGAASPSWSQGDFNYDGAVDADDVSLLDRGRAMQGAAIVIAVPEPGGLLAGCVLGAVAVGGRRVGAARLAAGSRVSCGR